MFLFYFTNKLQHFIYKTVKKWRKNKKEKKKKKQTAMHGTLLKNANDPSSPSKLVGAQLQLFIHRLPLVYARSYRKSALIR